MRGIRVHDETLRDGMQCPSGVDPGIGPKIEILHLLERTGVDSVNVGLPAAGPRALEDAVLLAREIVDARLGLRPGCAGRTVVADVERIAEVSQRAGIAIDVMTFIGSSPIRRLVEGWSVALVRQRSIDAIDAAVREGLTVTYVTEDTTRTPPEVLRELFLAAIDHGAARLCLCDTVGHATPHGTRALVRFTQEVIAESGAEVGIDWHGHDDRGLALANALEAADHGAHRIHGCVLGIGERVGNTPLEMLLLNLRLSDTLGARDLSHLPRLCRRVSEAMQMPMHAGHPFAEPGAPIVAEPPASEAPPPLLRGSEAPASPPRDPPV